MNKSRMGVYTKCSKLILTNILSSQPLAGILRLEANQWSLFFEKLSNSKYDLNRNLLNDKNGKFLFDYRYIVPERFFKEEFDNRFPLTREPYGMNDLVTKEVQLWSNLLKMLERMNTLEHLSEYRSVPDVLSALIHERAIVLLIIPCKRNNPYTAKQLRSEHQSQNLFSLDKNPFDKSISPVTYDFIEKAMKLSETRAISFT